MPSESPTASPSIRIHHNFFGPGAIAGIVIAGIIFFVLLFSVTFHYCFQTQPISSKKYFQYAGLPRNDQSSSEFVARQGQSQFDDLNDFFPNSGHQNEQFFNTFSDQQNQRSGHSTKFHTAVLQGHQSRILCLNMSEKLGLLFSGSESGEIAVWKVDNMTNECILRDHNDEVSCLVSNEIFLISGSRDRFHT
jgi:WD40 repeat protein